MVYFIAQAFTVESAYSTGPLCNVCGLGCVFWNGVPESSFLLNFSIFAP